MAVHSHGLTVVPVLRRPAEPNPSAVHPTYPPTHRWLYAPSHTHPTTHSAATHRPPLPLPSFLFPSSSPPPAHPPPPLFLPQANNTGSLSSMSGKVMEQSRSEEARRYFRTVYDFPQWQKHRSQYRLIDRLMQIPQ